MVLHPQARFSVQFVRYRLQAAGALDPSEHEQRLALLRPAVQWFESRKPETAEELLLLYQLHAAQDDARMGGRYLADAATMSLHARLELARHKALLGDGTIANSLTREVAADAQRALDGDPHQRNLRLLAAEAHVLLREYPQAVAVVNQEYEQLHDPAYAAALCRVYLAWWDAQARSQPSSPDLHLELLEHAADYAPLSQELRKRFIAAAKLIAVNDQANWDRWQQLKRRLQEHLRN